MVFPFLFVCAYERPVFIKVEKQITLFGFDLCEVFTLDTVKQYCQVCRELYSLAFVDLIGFEPTTF